MSKQVTLKDELKKRFPKRIEAIKKGSRRMAIFMECLDCVGGYIQDVINCTGTDCFLYAFRYPKAKVPGRVTRTKKEKVNV